jgi:L-ascorbate metabolism protein UlaG (beta-lactamase superfamily)
MKIFKYTHSCVRLEKDGRALVIDPGVWSEPSALRDASAVLITHEHVDHVDALRLLGLRVPVYGPAGAVVPGVAVQPLPAGSAVDIEGFAVTAVGAPHAIIHNGLPDCAHLGFVVDNLYHPGDSLVPPGVDIDVLCVPVQASWVRVGEAIEFVRSVAPMAAFGIHEGQLNERGLDAAHGWLAESFPSYRALLPGESL